MTAQCRRYSSNTKDNLLHRTLGWCKLNVRKNRTTDKREKALPLTVSHLGTLSIAVLHRKVLWICPLLPPSVISSVFKRTKSEVKIKLSFYKQQQQFPACYFSYLISSVNESFQAEK